MCVDHQWLLLITIYFGREKVNLETKDNSRELRLHTLKSQTRRHMLRFGDIELSLHAKDPLPACRSRLCSDIIFASWHSKRVQRHGWRTYNSIALMNPGRARAVPGQWPSCRHGNLLEDVDIAEWGIVHGRKLGASIYNPCDVKAGIGTGILAEVAPEFNSEVIAAKSVRWSGSQLDGRFWIGNGVMRGGIGLLASTRDLHCRIDWIKNKTGDVENVVAWIRTILRWIVTGDLERIRRLGYWW